MEAARVLAWACAGAVVLQLRKLATMSGRPGAVESWRNPKFNRAAVLLWGGLSVALGVGMGVTIAFSGKPWLAPLGLVMLVPAWLVFAVEALTADVSLWAEREQGKGKS